MSKKYTYKEYTASDSLYERYSKYQQRYAESIRESDKVLIQMVTETYAEMGGGQLSILDIGSSTGNLLYHLKNALPEIRLTGGDLMAQAIEECRANPRLESIQFEVMDIFSIPAGAPFDIIVCNAVLYLFDDDQFDRAINSVSAALKPGGWFLTFDFFHEFLQELEITERSRSHPEGLALHFRSRWVTEKLFMDRGFSTLEFRPFRISIDLPRGVAYGDNADGFEDLNSYTVKSEDGDRLLFRGTLFQPWCHLKARKRM